jgi:hypothetical protein
VGRPIATERDNSTGTVKGMTSRREGGFAKRQCARFGCSAVAVATFTFDSGARTVWLDLPVVGAARAGELCDRHARALRPPRGWQLDDRRAEPDPASAAAKPVALDEELRDLLDARSPLLARAFRSSGTL